MSDLLDQLVRARLGWVSPRIRTWYDDARLAEQLATGLTAEAERVGDAEFGTGYRDAVDADLEPDPLAWANRRLELDGGGWAVTGIRFRQLDRSRPFVDVVATDRPPSPGGLTTVAAAVQPAYEVFQPLCLRVDAPDPAELVTALDADPRFAAGRSGVDQHIVAGRVTDLLARQDLARQEAAPHDEVTLRPGEPVELAARAAAIYAQNSEESRLWATPEDAESLADCAAEGLLFEVLVGGTSAGIIAAVRDDAHGMSGFSMEEICLDPVWRGRGVAARAVRRLLERLPAREGDVLWGSIHPDNLPSLGQARAVGREVVGGYAWVTPRGMSGMPAV